MKKLSRIYIEITNVCNLSCSFCAENRRFPKFINPEEFRRMATEAKKYTDYIYLHVLGEPLCHPDLEEFLEIADELQLKVNITTNGTLLREQGAVLRFAKSLRKVAISIHSLETGEGLEREAYLENVAHFADLLSKEGKLCELRFWNLGAEEGMNVDNLSYLCKKMEIDKDAVKKARLALEKEGKHVLRENLFLGMEERFRWPSLEAPLTGLPVFCHGLRSQIAILCDGTVVPCCLDSNGEIALGNVLESPLEEILNSPRAKAIYEGFSCRTAVEELCKRCSFATKF